MVRKSFLFVHDVIHIFMRMKGQKTDLQNTEQNYSIPCKSVDCFQIVRESAFISISSYDRRQIYRMALQEVGLAELTLRATDSTAQTNLFIHLPIFYIVSIPHLVSIWQRWCGTGNFSDLKQLGKQRRKEMRIDAGESILKIYNWWKRNIENTWVQRTSTLKVSAE